MWELVNNTPFKANATFMQDDKTGELVWLVAVKATFDIANNGDLSISSEQVDVFDESQFKDEVDKSSLLSETDLVLEKKRVDVLLNAHAYAPNGEPITRLTVGVGIGKWSKQLKVIGNRKWKRFLGIFVKSIPFPFTKLEISYENAFGGGNTDDSEDDIPVFEPRNPIGTGFAKKRRDLKGQNLPNIETVNRATKKRPKRNKVAGFGPIAGHWSPRSKYAGTYDETWDQSTPRPPDFNPLYYQCAPFDQQLENINGGEPVVLYNLTPNGELKFKLPEIDIKFNTQFGDEKLNHTAKLHTIIIEAEHPRLLLVWLSALPCSNREEEIEHTKIGYKIKQM